MYIVDMYLRVSRACLVDGMSIREASRVFGLHRDTVRKMLSCLPDTAGSALPVVPSWSPTRASLIAYSKTTPYHRTGQALSAPEKQRHTAKRIFERLREEHGFDGGYTIVKGYVRERRRVVREMFVPLGHPPGHAQCDFGQALVVIGGVERRARCFVIDLPHSYGCFVKAYPSETTESFLDGHVSAIDRKQPLGKPQHSDKDRSQHTETDQEADPNQQCFASSKCVISIIITHLEIAHTDVYARCLRYMFTLRSRLVTQMVTLRETP